MKSFTMKNINTLNEVTYNIYNEYIDVVTNGNNIVRLNKNNKNYNQVIMDLINNGINKGYIISNFNIV